MRAGETELAGSFENGYGHRSSVALMVWQG